MKSTRKSIILVDDDINNLTLGYNLISQHYNVVTVDSGAKLFMMLERFEPDLILLDINMPEMDGYEAIGHLKRKRETKDIPVIFLTANSETEDELKGLSLGAIDYIIKPFSPSLLLKRIEVHLLVETQKRELEAQKKELIRFNTSLQEMVDERTEAIVALQNAMLRIFPELIENRDKVTGGHIERTQAYVRIMLDALQGHKVYGKVVCGWDKELVAHSAQLHDVGKIAISDSILQKPGKLNSEEFEKMKEHVMFGESVIENIISNTLDHAFLDEAKIMVSMHHERWDGSGYPRGVKGADIPLQGRIMALVDVYDALISVRPYKAALPHEQAVRIISDGRGTQFDPELVDIFEEIDGRFKDAGAAYTLH